jgi:hypothetical protein
VKLTPKFEAITARLPVSDVEKALTFYIDLLGFSLGWKWGDPLTHANVCRDSIALDMIATSPGRRGPALAYIRLSSVDAYFAELTARGVEKGELADRPTGCGISRLSIHGAIDSPSENRALKGLEKRWKSMVGVKPYVLFLRSPCGCG